MKKLLALFITTLTLSSKLIGDNLFLYNHTDNVELGDVIANKLVVQQAISGKTYTLTNNLSVTTSTNDVASYVLPHKIAIHQKENSTAYFNATPTEYVNDFKLPEVLKIKDSQFNFSAQGEFYVLSESIKQTTVGTSMGLIVFEKAALFVKAGDKFAHVYVLDGKATVLDGKSSKKKKELVTGDYLVITPQASLSPKEASIRNLGNSFSMKEVEDIEKEAHVVEIKALQIKLADVLFVNYSTNIFGVKLH